MYARNNFLAKAQTRRAGNSWKVSGPLHAAGKGAEVNPPRLHLRETVPQSYILDVPYPDLKNPYRQ